MWNQSQGELGSGAPVLVVGSGCSDWLYGTWSALFHCQRTLPVLMLISWTTPSITVWLAGPPSEVRAAVLVVLVDRVGPLAEAAKAGALPPGEDGLAVVGLGAEVGGLLAGRNRMEPDDVAVLVEDLGAVGVGRRAAEGRDGEVALAEIVAVGEDRDRRRRGGGVGGRGARQRGCGAEGRDGGGGERGGQPA